MVILVIVLGLLLTQSQMAGQKIRIKIENGVEGVYNPKSSEPSADEASKVQLDEEFTLSGPEAVFSRLVYFAVDAKRNI